MTVVSKKSCATAWHCLASFQKHNRNDEINRVSNKYTRHTSWQCPQPIPPATARRSSPHPQPSSWRSARLLLLLPLNRRFVSAFHPHFLKNVRSTRPPNRRRHLLRVDTRLLCPRPGRNHPLRRLSLARGPLLSTHRPVPLLSHLRSRRRPPSLPPGHTRPRPPAAA